MHDETKHELEAIRVRRQRRLDDLGAQRAAKMDEVRQLDEQIAATDQVIQDIVQIIVGRERVVFVRTEEE